MIKPPGSLWVFDPGAMDSPLWLEYCLAKKWYEIGKFHLKGWEFNTLPSLINYDMINMGYLWILGQDWSNL